MPGPMNGVRVVELAAWVAGPSAGGILADWGADVIKVEPPAGDPLRAIYTELGPDVAYNPFFDPDNRGKRSIVLNLREPRENQRALELIATADVFLTNMRGAALQRLGLDHETLLARDPRLIYAFITGYGLSGPTAAAGAFDLGACWARGAVADLLCAPGQDLPLQRSGMGDHFAGVAAAGMISAALYDRERTGEGQLVSTSLVRVAGYQMSSDLNTKLLLDLDPSHPVRTAPANPLANNYSAADGKRFWLLGIESDRHWPALTRIVERPELESDRRFSSIQARYENASELVGILDVEFAKRPREDWARRFDSEANFFWSPVNDVADLLSDPQTEASGMLVTTEDGSVARQMVASPVDFSRTPAAVRTRAPRLGEHTDELLQELAGHTAATVATAG
ncbi:crotonobetainyl-CoA:carnitine CoA-transferase CaiB-like acyl-CoA transferase [Kribbella aluminosa]|uniref:Crotonobetainyl-CoA:carnitine CoA-transferase CaiB-like acyl-CoA transferase n=1 Tax=Kribbella aluminosa TaxID=416017 RepID=A0ABS4UIH1_9ACTN|nr:CoA transferase [Kribbella aluminosa]MBP2351453.1 crotonobetainyl-CoA:carnitine CoA-transferase CaiB-like acyl-CoA transferase [Kribbella aluminosa]